MICNRIFINQQNPRREFSRDLVIKLVQLQVAIIFQLTADKRALYNLVLEIRHCIW